MAPYGSSNHRLTRYNERVTGSKTRREEREQVIQALALQSYHLPGNSWCDDWMQYFCNNHPLFGICCHSRLHPIGFRMRVIFLIGSIVFGLAVTNIIWLWTFNNQDDASTPILTLSFGSASLNTTDMVNSTDPVDPFASSEIPQTELKITQGMVFLWTVGGGLHATFDNTIWYITACSCCLPGQPLECLDKYRKWGSYMVVFAVVLVTALASFVVVLRASLEGSSQDEDVDLSNLDTAGIADDEIQLGNIDGVGAFDFIVSYLVEITLALFVYFPIVGTLLFSGILGCGKVPVLGGRPYEVLVEEKMTRRKLAQGYSKDHSTGSDDTSVI